MVFLRRDDEEEELENPDDEDATLGDDVLDEVEEDTVDVADDMEGFGHIDETEKDKKEDDEEEKDDEDKDDHDAPLEDDAEDVDFDTFDDVDEM